MQKHLCWCVTLRRFMAPLRSRRVSLNPLPVLSPPPANVAPLPPTWVDAPQHTNISRIVHCHSLYLKGYYEYWDWCAQLKDMSLHSFSLGPSFLPIEPSPPLLTYECYVKFNFRVFKIVLFNYLYILVSGCLCGHGLFVRHIWFIWVALLWAGAACMGNHDKP